MKLNRNSYTCCVMLFVILFIDAHHAYTQCLCVGEDEISTAPGIGWKIPYDLGADDEAWDIEPIDDASDPDLIADNGLIVVGATHMLTTASDAFVMRLNVSGGVEWQIPFDKGLDDGAYAAHQTSTGEILVCGTSRTNKYTPGYNQNAWILKLNVADGSYANGWTNGKEYGSTGRDIAYDIKEDLDGNYVVVGEANKPGNDVPSNVHSSGDYWVFKIEPDGDLLNSKVFYGGNESTGSCRDYARSVVVDCNSGHYVVTGFCKSCDSIDGNHSELLMVKIYPTTFQATSAIYGFDGNVQHDWDYGSYNIIQPLATFGSCTSGDNFLSTGLQHPGVDGPPCFEKNDHDFWLVKTHSSLANNTTFDVQCDNANVGNAYGGYKKDNGHAAVQTCQGYLIAGLTNSSKEDDNQEPCDQCQVQCNHYECLATPTEDIWLVHVNSTDGLYTWEESVGTSADEGAYSIKRLPDGSYVMAGYTTQNGERDFYVVKFQLTDACPGPTGLSVTTATYCATFSWNMDPCIPRYKLEYKKTGAGPWIVIDNATSPKSVNTYNQCPGTSYEWRVTAYCSPSNFTTTSSTFSVACCNGVVAGCNICNTSGGKISYSNKGFLSIYPNPSDGSVRVNLQLPNEIDEMAFIKVLDQAGKVVFVAENRVENGLLDQRYSIAKLPSGFYWLEVLMDGNRYQSKLIVQTE